MLTKKDLAERLQVSEVTINRMLADGMPKVRVRGQVRFIYDEVETWLKAGDTIGRSQVDKNCN